MRIVSLKVKNFRSLKDFSIEGLGSVNVLYGENDIGKSNVLAALDVVFRPKQVLSKQGNYQPTSCLSGEVWDFDSNFFEKNTDKPIQFSVSIGFSADEIAGSLLPGLSGGELTQLSRQLVTLSGEITFIGIHAQRGECANSLVNKIQWGNHPVFDSSAKANQFQPGEPGAFLGLDQKAVKDLYDRIDIYLLDAFQLVPAPRYFRKKEEINKRYLELSPGNVKNTLVHWQQGTPDSDSRAAFLQIEHRFSSPPFEFGRPAPTRKGTEAGIDIIRGKLELSIEHFGTGIQQILILLSYLCSGRKRRILGIEEIELNLSPKTQGKVIDQLRLAVEDTEFPLDQVFLTSHSSLLARGGVAKPYHLTMRDGGTIVVGVSDFKSSQDEYFRPLREAEACLECPVGAAMSSTPQYGERPDLSTLVCKECNHKIATGLRIAQEKKIAIE